LPTAVSRSCEASFSAVPPRRCKPPCEAVKSALVLLG